MTASPPSLPARPAALRRGLPRFFGVLALVVVQIAVLAVLFQLVLDFSCSSAGPVQLCMFIRDGVARFLAVATLLALLIPVRRAAFARLWQDDGRGAFPLPWAAVQIAGFLLMLAPAVLVRDLSSGFAPAVALWGAGAVLASVGALFWAAAPRTWAEVLRRLNPLLILPLIAALAAPELLRMADALWAWDALTEWTFSAVVALISLAEGKITMDPAQKLLGLDDFVVLVGQPCSGMQGIALITAIMAAFLTLYRHSLRFPRALLLIPIAILASAALNVVRIVVLIWIGARFSPSLAVNGFHSHAGWLLLTLLAFAMIGLTLKTPFFLKAPAAVGPAARPEPLAPLRSDPVAAMILPFAVFMLSDLVAKTFLPHPELGYPARALAMAAALWYFRDVFRALPWRADALALASGAAVGVAWIVTSPTDPAGDAALMARLQALPVALMALWVAARVIGTTILVPLIEEAFFRGYLLQRLNRGGPAMAALAVLVSSAAFGILHGRWLAGFLAGVVFGLVYLRRGRLSDAVWSHATANLLIGLLAAATGRWSLI